MDKTNITKAIKEIINKKDIKAKFIKQHNHIALKVEKESLIKFLRELKNSSKLRFTILSDLFAADFPKRKKRFEIVYNLLSLKVNQRIILKLSLSDGENAPSVCKVFSSSTWYEREIFDMFGIKFDKATDMRRILTDYGFTGHPLRKDFPLTGYKEVRYDERKEQVIYEDVTLDQEYRSFDFITPWEGAQKAILPGDEKANSKK